MISFWEKEHFVTYDYIIVGAGITGLSLAAELMEKYPKCTVLILERGMLPTGASTKNAGFACFGSLSEMVHDLDVMGSANLLSLVKNRIKGLKTLRNRLGDNNIGFDNNGGYELIMDNNIAIDLNLQKINELLNPLFGSEVFTFMPNAVSKFGFNSSQISTVIHNPFEGQIDTGLMMKKLMLYVTNLGVTIITGAEVVDFEKNNDFMELETKSIGNQQLKFKAGKVFFCTNAFTKTFFPELEMEPGRGQVLITEPIPYLPIRGTFSFDEGYYYFRNINNRVLFGGGRNLDFDKEQSSEFELNEKIQANLIKYLKELILPNTDFKIAQQWCGIMAFGNDKLPIVQKYSDQIFIGARLNGMGVAIGSNIAKQLISLL